MDSTKKQPQFLSRSLTYHHPSPNPRKPFFKNHTDDDVTTSKSKSKLSSDPSSLSSAVLYVTSLRSIRRTFEDCSYIRSILRGFHVSVDERDVAMDSSFRFELQSLLKTRAVSLPQLFVRGRHIGGADEVRRLYEDGKLEKTLEGVRRVDPTYLCRNCGGARFVLCLNCNGSRKVYDEEEDRMKRCGECNENGLVRCFNCQSI